MSTYIFESEKVESIIDFIDDESIYISDIDHTLIEPVQIIGSVHWEKYTTQKLMDRGLSFEKARQEAFKLWRQVQAATDIKVVEESVYNLLKILQSRKIPIMGLTSRSAFLKDLTFKQLARARLDQIFTYNYDCHDLPSPKLQSHFSKGTVFCGDDPKHHALEAFLKHNQINLKKIIFVDDQKDHIHELEELCYKLGIDYVGMHYVASSHKNFDAEIAEMQHKHLPKIISDLDALQMLES